MNHEALKRIRIHETFYYTRTNNKVDTNEIYQYTESMSPIIRMPSRILFSFSPTTNIRRYVIN